MRQLDCDTPCLRQELRAQRIEIALHCMFRLIRNVGLEFLRRLSIGQLLRSFGRESSHMWEHAWLSVLMQI